MTKFIQATVADAATIEKIAKPIWREHYTQIIGVDQIEYMLKKFQSRQAICEQIEQGYWYYIIEHQKTDAGYMALQKRDTSLFISKFYLNTKHRGQGIAKDMLNYVKSLALDNHCTRLELTVNKFNPAYDIYLKLGFENVESIQIDIGAGYIMDDYRMQKTLAN